nr:hypothetical protein [Fodinicola feengrottensis]
MCLAEAAHTAALRGDHKTAAELAAEARQRALPAWRVHGLWLEIALPWVAAAGGKHDQSVRLGLRAAERARDCSATSFELIALHDLVRLGAADRAAARLAELATWAEGPCPAIYADHATALLAGDAVALGAVSDRFAGLGMMLHAAEAMTQSAAAFRAVSDTRSGQAAAGRAGRHPRRCLSGRQNSGLDRRFDAHADGPGKADRPVGGSRPDQPANRRKAVGFPSYGGKPPLLRLRQARHPQPRGTSRAARRLSSFPKDQTGAGRVLDHHERAASHFGALTKDLAAQLADALGRFVKVLHRRVRRPLWSPRVTGRHRGEPAPRPIFVGEQQEIG